MNFVNDSLFPDVLYAVVIKDDTKKSPEHPGESVLSLHEKKIEALQWIMLNKKRYLGMYPNATFAVEEL